MDSRARPEPKVVPVEQKFEVINGSEKTATEK
jgi:hypothetical protein